MKKLTVSIKIFLGLIALYAVLAAVYVFLPFPGIIPSQQLPASKSVLALINSLVILVLYGGLGFIGLKLSQKVGFADIWDKKVTNKERFLIPVAIGVILGILFAVIDSGLSHFHQFGRLPHPPFPTSIVASMTAAIGEEIMFRLFFISFWVWLVSFVILRRRWKNTVFWIVSVFSAVIFAVGHIPSLLIFKGLTSPFEIPPIVLVEILLLNSAVSIPAAYYMRKSGYLAAVGIHFWTDIVWHVIFGLF